MKRINLGDRVRVVGYTSPPNYTGNVGTEEEEVVREIANNFGERLKRI